MQIYTNRDDRIGHNKIRAIAVPSLVVIMAVIAIFSMSLPVMADTDATSSKEEEGSWSKVGREFGDVAGAVGDASKETWESTKETSAKVWDKTKEAGSDVADGTGEVADATVETSKSAWQKTKVTSVKWYNSARSTIHNWTAPSSGK